FAKRRAPQGVRVRTSTHRHFQCGFGVEVTCCASNAESGFRLPQPAPWSIGATEAYRAFTPETRGQHSHALPIWPVPLVARDGTLNPRTSVRFRHRLPIYPL